MHLYVNTCNEDFVSLALFSDDMENKKRIFIKKTFKKNNFLDAIEKFLKKQNLKPENLTGMLCVKGPGKFSSVRAGVAVANAMSWFLNIPISELLNNEIPKEEKLFWNFLKKKIDIRKQKHIIEPNYGRDPNITVMKK